MTEQIAIQAITTLYNDFQSYFDDGKIIVTGSFYYTYLDPSYGLEYHDLDLVIDERPEFDYILHEIHDHYSAIDENFGGFVEDHNGSLIGCVGVYRYIEQDTSLYEYVRVDMFRNDFSTNLPLTEIVPGVFTERLPDSKFVELFQGLTAVDPSSAKFQNSLDFFQNRVDNS